MDLQHLFYIIGIIFMLTVLAIIFGGAVIVYYIRKRLVGITRLASRPAETAAIVGAGLVEGLANKFKEWTSPNRK